MRRLAAAAALSLGLAAPALADTIDALKANTLVLTGPDGGVTIVLVGDDGKMEQVNSAGMWAAGFWTGGDNELCWTARGAARVCIPLPAGKGAGDSWEIRGPGCGQAAQIAEIREGRADLDAVAAGIRRAASRQGS